VVHGEEESSLAFADAIQQKFGYTAYVPRWGETIDVETMRSSIASYGAEGSFGPIDKEVEGLNDTIHILMNKYKKVRDENRALDMKQLKEDINDAREWIAMIIDEL
jgi:hypothetical protein